MRVTESGAWAEEGGFELRASDHAAAPAWRMMSCEGTRKELCLDRGEVLKTMEHAP